MCTWTGRGLCHLRLVACVTAIFDAERQQSFFFKGPIFTFWCRTGGVIHEYTSLHDEKSGLASATERDTKWSLYKHLCDELEAEGVLRVSPL